MTKPPGPPNPRHAAIDWIKAAAIIAVVFTHAGFPPWDPRITWLDHYLAGFWVQFHVPCFLLVSGFLYQRSHPIAWPAVRARLKRVLVPYLIASCVVQLSGLTQARNARDVVFQFLTASSLGIYYYVFLIVMFIPSIWILSRLSRVAGTCFFFAWLLSNVGLELYIVRFVLSHQGAHGWGGLFWLARNPLVYTFAMFLAGWTLAANLPRARAFFLRNRSSLALACLGGIAVWTAYHLTGAHWLMGGLLRVVYSLSVALAMVLLTYERAVPTPIRFLSEASFSIYLYHQMFQIVVGPLVAAWPPGARILALALGGLGFGSVLVLAGRTILGPRSRSLLGA